MVLFLLSSQCQHLDVGDVHPMRPMRPSVTTRSIRASSPNNKDVGVLLNAVIHLVNLIHITFNQTKDQFVKRPNNGVSNVYQTPTTFLSHHHANYSFRKKKSEAKTISHRLKLKKKWFLKIRKSLLEEILYYTTILLCVILYVAPTDTKLNAYSVLAVLLRKFDDMNAQSEAICGPLHALTACPVAMHSTRTFDSSIRNPLLPNIFISR